jgi:hypothetical protein
MHSCPVPKLKKYPILGYSFLALFLLYILQEGGLKEGKVDIGGNHREKQEMQAVCF